MTFEPRAVGEYILVQLDPPAEKYGRIHIPQTAQRLATTGVVRSTSPEGESSDDYESLLGRRILFGELAGRGFHDPVGNDWRRLRRDEVLGIIGQGFANLGEYRPYGTKVLVKPMPQDAYTRSKWLLVLDIASDTNLGLVVAAKSMKLMHKSIVHVLYAGVHVTLRGEDYIVIDEEDVLMIYEFAGRRILRKEKDDA